MKNLWLIFPCHVAILWLCSIGTPAFRSISWMNWINSDHIEMSCSSQRRFSFDPLSLDLPGTRFSILFLIEWLKIVFYKLPTSNSVGLSEQLSNWGNFNWRVSLLICKVNLFSDSFCIRWMRSRLWCLSILKLNRPANNWSHCMKLCMLVWAALKIGKTQLRVPFWALLAFAFVVGSLTCSALACACLSCATWGDWMLCLQNYTDHICMAFLQCA